MEQQRIKSGKDIHGVSATVMTRFMEYGWPGNVREMKSVLEYAFVVAESEQIQLDNLPGYLHPNTAHQPSEEATEISDHGPPHGPDEKTALIEALRLSNGNKTKAARILGVHRMTVFNRMRKYGVELRPGIGFGS